MRGQRAEQGIFRAHVLMLGECHYTSTHIQHTDAGCAAPRVNATENWKLLVTMQYPRPITSIRITQVKQDAVLEGWMKMAQTLQVCGVACTGNLYLFKSFAENSKLHYKKQNKNLTCFYQTLDFFFFFLNRMTKENVIGI